MEAGDNQLHSRNLHIKNSGGNNSMDNLITLPNGAIWDNTKQMSEQEQEAQEYVNAFVSCKPDAETNEPAGYFTRPLTQVWEKDGLKAKKTFIYMHPATHDENGLVLVENINIERA